MEFIYEDEKTKTILSGCYTRDDLYPIEILQPDMFDARTTIIDEFAFYGCKFLKDVFLPNQIQTIGRNAFALCSNMKTITLPEELVFIEDEAFLGCENLNSITIPTKVVRIYDHVFRRCKSLKKINFEFPTYTMIFERNAFTGTAPETIKIRGELVNSSNYKDLRRLKDAGMSLSNLKVEDESLQLLIECGEI